MHPASPASDPMLARALAAQTVRGLMVTAIAYHPATNASLTSTQTTLGNVIHVTNPATVVQLLENPTAWAVPRDVSCSVSRMWSSHGQWREALRASVVCLRGCIITCMSLCRWHLRGWMPSRLLQGPDGAELWSLPPILSVLLWEAQQRVSHLQRPPI